MNGKPEIELKPEPPHRHVDRIPRSLERWGIAVIVVIAVSLAAAAILFGPLLKK